MNKSFAIPQQVIDCLNFFDCADRGMAFSAIFDYANKGIEPSDTMTPAARGAFEFARRVIDPILERRRKAAERRAARKASALATATANAKASEANSAKAPCTPPDEHIRTMKKVVALAFKLCSTKAKRDDKIFEEMNKRYPGQYKDIIYDDRGNVLLVPAA